MLSLSAMNMRFRKIATVVTFLFLYVAAYAQNGCSTLGQTPSTAFPVCGSAVFRQFSVPVCGGLQVHGHCDGVDGLGLSDLNPYWYKFTCFEAGTLAFTISPTVNTDDYDWQLFDVTGKDPNDVYTDVTTFVACNWSGTTGNTGASAAGTSLQVCATTPQHPNQPTFSGMPLLIKGHDYILLISHFLGSDQSGYALSFNGGTASITDTVAPKMKSARASCDGQSIALVLNKKMRCRTLAANGSDFSISPATGANIQSILGYGCSNSFDVDSVLITLDTPLPPGNYSLVMNKGTDNNTLLDNCDTPIPEKDSTPFIVYAIQPTPMDSVLPVGCAPDTVYLLFRNSIKCSTVDSDGSDFFVNGTAPVTIKGAGGNCTNGLSSVIKVWFTQPIKLQGSFSIGLKIGNDGNTFIDECGQETPPGPPLPFTTADTVTAAFTYHLGLGCTFDTLACMHPGYNNISAWNWTFDVNGTSTQQNPVFLFPDYGPKHIALEVSNGVCSDTSSADILLDNELRAIFTAPKELCPEDAAIFPDSSIGKIISYSWNFGDGTTSILRDPPPKNYPPAPTRAGRIYPISLIVQNDIGCYDTLTQQMKLLYTCFIDVPTGFTPNGDGLNDYLYPLNAYKAANLQFRVYNRLGQKIFETTDWTKKWDGTINGNPQGSGVYVWTLVYTDTDTGIRKSLKGTTVLIR